MVSKARRRSNDSRVITTNRALFLDRDGVINLDHGYVCSNSNFDFVDGIFDLCRAACENGYALFVVTNQAGIGRGYYTEDQFRELTLWMCDAFRAQGAEIAHVYHCPSHPQYGIGALKQDSFFRKPNPGMILQAADDYGLDLAASLLIGDKETDIQAGIAAGVGLNILLRPDWDASGRPEEGYHSIGRLTDAVGYLAGKDSA